VLSIVSLELKDEREAFLRAEDDVKN